MVRIGTESSSDYALPREVCLDLVKKQKGGKLSSSGSCDPDTKGIKEGPNAKDIASQLLHFFGTSFFSNSSSCLDVNYGLSYFKIPVLNPKKGAGLRVKRILM